MTTRPQRKFRTSGKPMKRRTAYKIYRAFMLYCDVKRVCKRLFSDDSFESVRSNMKAIANELDMTPQQVTLMWNRYCRCGVDRFNRMTRKVDRDVLGKSHPVGNWKRYGFGKFTREKQEINLIAWNLSAIQKLIDGIMAGRDPIKWTTNTNGSE